MSAINELEDAEQRLRNHTEALSTGFFRKIDPEGVKAERDRLASAIVDARSRIAANRPKPTDDDVRFLQKLTVIEGDFVVERVLDCLSNATYSAVSDAIEHGIKSAIEHRVRAYGRNRFFVAITPVTDEKRRDAIDWCRNEGEYVGYNDPDEACIELADEWDTYPLLNSELRTGDGGLYIIEAYMHFERGGSVPFADMGYIRQSDYLEIEILCEDVTL